MKTKSLTIQNILKSGPNLLVSPIIIGVITMLFESPTAQDNLGWPRLEKTRPRFTLPAFSQFDFNQPLDLFEKSTEWMTIHLCLSTLNGDLSDSLLRDRWTLKQQIDLK